MQRQCQIQNLPIWSVDGEGGIEVQAGYPTHIWKETQTQRQRPGLWRGRQILILPSKIFPGRLSVNSTAFFVHTMSHFFYKKLAHIFCIDIPVGYDLQKVI